MVTYGYRVTPAISSFMVDTVDTTYSVRVSPSAVYSRIGKPDTCTCVSVCTYMHMGTRTDDGKHGFNRSDR